LIKVEVGSRIANITLNRPEKRNALSPELIAELTAAFVEAVIDKAVNVIVIRGEGKDFCAGLDIKAAKESDQVLDHLAAARVLADLFLSMRRCSKPIIAAVHGRAIGGGAGLATAADLVVATESSQFRYPEVNLGFVAAVVEPLLRRVVGEKRAFEMVALGEPISAAAASALGLVNRVYPDEEFDVRVREFAAMLATKSPSALALTKELLHHVDGMTLEGAVNAGVYVNALARMTPDARKGFAQFVDKS
jgi:methylglutaconyl-CoA hydratase